MVIVNKMMANGGGRQDTNDSEQEEDGANASDTGPSRPVAVFSVAQALSMVRQRREEQDRSRQDEEKVLEEQRRQKAKEKRQRRRKNQKEKKAKLREATASSPVPTTTTTTITDDDDDDDDVSDSSKHDCVMVEADRRAGGTKRAHDHETDDDGQLNDHKIDDEIDLKRLPVKKRLRIRSSEGTPVIGAITLDESKTNQANTTATKKVTSFLPRALLLKKSKR